VVQFKTIGTTGSSISGSSSWYTVMNPWSSFILCDKAG